MELINKENKRNFGDDYIKILIKELQKAGKYNTGKLVNSLDYRLQDESKAIDFLIEGEDYFTYVDEGRRPGSYPNISDLSNWASTNGISSDAVFPIARSIYKFGIKPTNIANKATTKFMNGKPLKRFEDDVSSNLEEMVVDNLEELNK